MRKGPASSDFDKRLIRRIKSAEPNRVLKLAFEINGDVGKTWCLRHDKVFKVSKAEAHSAMVRVLQKSATQRLQMRWQSSGGFHTLVGHLLPDALSMC